MVTKKYLFFLMLVILIRISSFGQDSKRKFTVIWHGMDLSLNVYSDSLNFMNSRNPLPVFLNDYLIDWKLRNINIDWLAADEKISYRHAIIGRITNEETLQRIINSKNPNYDKRYVPEEQKKITPATYDVDFPDLPSMEFSLRDLAKKRLSEIRELKEKFRKAK